MRTLRPRLSRTTSPAQSWDHGGLSPSARGYGYAWEKLRRQILARDGGLCQCPNCQGGRVAVTPADQVHHVKGKAEARALGWTDEQIDHPNNLQAINRACHAAITARQGGKRGA